MTLLHRRLSVALVPLLAALACGASPSVASAATLAQRADVAVRASGVGGMSSVYVWDQQSRDVLYTRAAARAVTPASTMKLLTSAAALARLGPDHRFETRLALQGHQKGNRWIGDVWLIGGGDPSLSTFGFMRDNYGGVGSNLASLVSPLRARGIEGVTGRIMVDDDMLDEVRWVPAWKRSFRFEEAGALGALTVNQSLVGRWVGTDSSHAPDLRTGTVYRELLRRQGIFVAGGTVSGSAPDSAEIVATLPSPPLWKLLHHMNQASDNFYAEILLKNIGAARFGEGASTVDGTRSARAALGHLGVRLDSVRWVDGSGLAYDNRVTARAVGHVLGIGAQAPWGEQWIASFARSGARGTLRTRMTRRPFRGRVSAKTGTLRHASALAGFSSRLGSNRRYGFVVLTYDPRGVPISYRASRRLQDRVASILVR